MKPIIISLLSGPALVVGLILITAGRSARAVDLDHFGCAPELTMASDLRLGRWVSREATSGLGADLKLRVDTADLPWNGGRDRGQIVALTRTFDQALIQPSIETIWLEEDRKVVWTSVITRAQQVTHGVAMAVLGRRYLWRDGDHAPTDADLVLVIIADDLKLLNPNGELIQDVLARAIETSEITPPPQMTTTLGHRLARHAYVRLDDTLSPTLRLRQTFRLMRALEDEFARSFRVRR